MFVWYITFQLLPWCRNFFYKTDLLPQVVNAQRNGEQPMNTGIYLIMLFYVASCCNSSCSGFSSKPMKPWCCWGHGGSWWSQSIFYNEIQPVGSSWTKAKPFWQVHLLEGLRVSVAGTVQLDKSTFSSKSTCFHLTCGNTGHIPRSQADWSHRSWITKIS